MNRMVVIACALSIVTGCDDGDGDGTPGDDLEVERRFTLRIENVAPFSVLKASSQQRRTSGTDGWLAPGDAYEIRFTAGTGHHVTFASMLAESNDWVFAPVVEGIPLYTDGVPTSGDVTGYVRLWDVGTELDQEPGVGDATGVHQATRTTGAADPDRRVRLVDTVTTLSSGASFQRPAIESMIQVLLIPGPDRQFTLRITNASTSSTLVTSTGTRAITLSPVAWAVHAAPAPLFRDGEAAPETGLETLAEAGLPDTLSGALRYVRGTAGPLSKGIAVVHTVDAPLFTPGQADRGLGLERLAEDGDESALLAGMGQVLGAPLGITPFTSPVGAAAAGPAAPGEAFEMSFSARPGDRLSFATMFSGSNDWFFAPPPTGIALFAGDDPRWGDVTSEVRLYDLGTELDEELEVGPSTGTQQAVANTGRVDRDTLVREVTVDRFEPSLHRQLRVTLAVDAP